MIKSKSSNKFAFILITMLFFLWGSITSINDVLIDSYKSIYQLSDLESMIVLLAFFGAYGVGAFVYYLISRYKEDPINKVGYKSGMSIGLLISAIGCFVLYAVNDDGYYAAVGCFFFIGLGLTILQISCNPYIALLGDPEGASSRLNLSQGFNSLGTTLGPLLTGYIILSYVSKVKAIQDIYLVCGIIFTLFSIMLYFIKLPDYTATQPPEKVRKKSAFQYPHLTAGMLAVFFYVGAEVMIGSKILPYLKLPEIGNFSETEAVSYLGIYWGGAMIGRLVIAIISNPKYALSKRIWGGLLMIFLSVTTLLIFITFKNLLPSENDLSAPLSFGEALIQTVKDISPIGWFIALQFILMLIFHNSSRKLLSAFAIIIILALLSAYIFEGYIALWSILAIGLFNSVMWSNIFTLAIDKLGDYTSQGSSLLIIMVFGGAILPLGMGWIIDETSNLKNGFLFPIISYLYILYFGIYGCKLKAKRNPK